MVGRGDRVHGDTQVHGGDFCAVQEVSPQESKGIEGVEQEDKECRGNGRRVIGCREARADGEAGHAQGHAGTADHEHGAAAQPVDGPERHEAGEEFPCQRARSKDLRESCAELEVLLEDGRRVDRDEVSTAHLLEELEGETKTEAVEEALVIVLGEHL